MLFDIESAEFLVAADAQTAAVLRDTFDPVLSDLTVTFNGEVWEEGVNYTYEPATGLFVTVPGQITVPAATYPQAPDGSWGIIPGEAVLTVTGNI